MPFLNYKYRIKDFYSHIKYSKIEQQQEITNRQHIDKGFQPIISFFTKFYIILR